MSQVLFATYTLRDAYTNMVCSHKCRTADEFAERKAAYLYITQYISPIYNSLYIADEFAESKEAYPAQ